MSDVTKIWDAKSDGTLKTSLHRLRLIQRAHEDWVLRNPEKAAAVEEESRLRPVSYNEETCECFNSRGELIEGLKYYAKPKSVESKSAGVEE